MPQLAPPGSAIQSLEDASSYLEGLINLERRPELGQARLGLRPIRRLLERLDGPERALSILHVAGSKGKGSTCLFAESILRAAGERVGTFTSPHLVCWTERFRVDGREVEPDRLAAAVDTLRPHVDALRAEDPAEAPTFFDATTAAALLLFAEARVDRAILEVGLGGRLDSTNAVNPAVTCITSIELEHTDKLGETLAEIAGEKAGILKAGVPCVTGRLPAEAEAAVERRAGELGVPLLRLGVDFEPVSAEAVCVLGAAQRDNAALARAMVAALGGYAPERLDEVSDRGLRTARLPGRVELLAREPWIVVDGAHTRASARVLAEALGELPAKRRHLLLSVSGGKDLAAILDALLQGATRVTVTCSELRRSLPAAELGARIRAAAPGLDVVVIDDPHQAVRAARAALAPDDLLCATGSIYLAGIARPLLHP
ncbi:MAG: bifunctional folylpolyglutamate synthase/dihydrofolate synthase [Deltaproteobacteria bacterium]|nr:bifunctional folylpolyglutamate synthase/dihydrofolate synthase [Deltaproteobacteria bacterium]MBW2418907.1 bifunctional folylpolyglutamate synthase/dihydrofolate synthase [Deltaproteobacteria bacterium]